MKIKALFIYPIKGIRGVSLDKVSIETRGLAHDRRYMIADLGGNLISQRNTPVLTQMLPTRKDGAWRIDFGADHIFIPDDTYTDKALEVDVWGNLFIANEVSPVVSAWFSRQLNFSCHLVTMPNEDSRIKDIIKPPYQSPVSFADGYPINILGTRSLAELNSKLVSAIPVDRFRSNILIETDKPHEEDDWGDFKIGNNTQFRNIKPCLRCQVITIDQETGKMGKEPTRTLASYRNVGNEISFGSNVIVMIKGEIKVGDQLDLLDS